MKIILSVPSGFHARELLIPLKPYLEQDADITEVICLTPGAPYQEQLFPDYGPRFKFQDYLPNSADYQKLFQSENPDLVITNTSGLDPNDVDILKGAKAAGIKTMTFIASWDNVWKMERLKNKAGPQELADHFIVWNEIMRDHLKKVFSHIKYAQISVIGAPRLDYFSHDKRIPSKEELFNKLNIPNDGGKLIHFATTELYPMEYIIKEVYQAIEKGIIKENLHLYASVHPGGDIGKHQLYQEKYGAIVRYSFGRQASTPSPDFQYNPTIEDIYYLVALFKHTDVLINQSSTVAIESFAGGTPVINVKYGQPLDWWRWYRSMVYRDFKQHYTNITDLNATSVVSNKKQLIGALKSYLADPSQGQPAREKTLQRMITTVDGTASKKVIAKIKALVSS